jgi:acyl dehydratase
MPTWSYVERYFEDYVLGERVDSPSKTIDQSDVNLFAGLTLDFHPAHVDEVYARTRYGRRLVHGVLTFAIVTGLNVEYNLLAVSYGYEKIRFPGAVYAGDSLHATSEVIDLRHHRRTEIGLVTKRYTGFNQDGQTVLSCEHVLAVDRRKDPR